MTTESSLVSVGCDTSRALVRDSAGGGGSCVSIENSYDAIEAALRPLVVDDDSAGEVYSALYQVGWVPLASTAQTYSEAWELRADQGQPFFYYGWRDAGDFVASARGKGESYMDVFMELSVDSAVSERVRRVMESLGLRPVL